MKNYIKFKYYSPYGSEFNFVADIRYISWKKRLLVSAKGNHYNLDEDNIKLFTKLQTIN